MSILRGLAAARASRERKVRGLVATSAAAPGAAQGVRELVEDLVTAVAKPNSPSLSRSSALWPLDLQGWRRWTTICLEKVLPV